MDTEFASSLMKEAQANLSKFKLQEAESCFFQILETYQEATTSDGATPVPKQVHWSDQSERLSTEELDILSQALSGLCDICLKRAQMKRYNRYDWCYYNLCALAYLRQIVHFCEKNEDLEEEGWKDVDVVAKKVSVEERLNSLQQNYIRNLQRCVIHHSDSTVNFEWLDGFQKFIVETMYAAGKAEEGAPQPPQEKAPQKAGGVSRENSVKESSTEKPPKTMDIRKLQKAISKLVRNISADIRRRCHRRLSEETMRRTVSCEIISLLSPISDDEELARLFERVIAEDEEEPEEISTTMEMDIDTSVVKSGMKSKKDSSDSISSSAMSSPRHQPKIKPSSSSSSTSSEASGHPDNDKQEILAATNTCQGPNTSQSGIPLQVPEQSGASVESMQENSNPPQQESKPTTVTVEDSNGNTTDPLVLLEAAATAAGPPYNLPGVLTLWKSYNSMRPTTLQVKPYTLHGFEEVSPLTEANCSPFKKSGTKMSPRQQISVHPLSPCRLYEMLAYILTEFLNIYETHVNCDIATELYKYALGLVYQCPASNRNGVLIAKILQRIGVLKSGRGDIVAGCQLLNEAMQVYKSLPMKDKSVHIINTWVDLAQAYLKEQGHVTSLFSHIMNEVRSELSQEFKPDTFHIPIIEESDDSDSSQGDSYAIHIYEAIDCLQSALSELQKLQPVEGNHISLLVTILTKLADCHIVTGNYDKAILLYEEAMGHCQQAYGSETVENNAHMLSMLGICNFLLGHYPKAAKLLETASILQQHLYGYDTNFGAIFTLTMLALNFYKMRQYHKCIVWCLKSHEKNQVLFGCPVEEVIATLDYNRAWYIIQNLFTLGYAYFTLDFFEKAISYLELAKGLLDRCEGVDIKQHVKLLKVIADSYVKVEWNESALEVYQNALTIAATIGNEKSSVALTNQLLNCMASVEVHVRHYSGAADYLEQALDHQKNVESNIKEDLIGLEYRLGKTYILSGDLDKAIDCFEDCLEAIREIPGTPGKEMVGALSKIANLYYVKGLMQEDNDFMNELLLLAQTNYSKAVSSDETSSATVYYANFLMQQGDYAEAVYLLLRHVFMKKTFADKEVVFAGVEQALIPEQLSQECSGIDEVVFDTKAFAAFIVLLCYKQLKLVKDMNDCLVIMYKSVLSSKNPFSHFLMAYAFVETGLFEEAAESFAMASTLTSCENIQLAMTNSLLCYCVHMYQTIVRAFRHILEYTATQQHRVTKQKAIGEAAGIAIKSTDYEEVRPAETRDESSVSTQHKSYDSGEVLNMTISSFESSSSKSRSDILNTSSHYESDSSFVTDQSMLSDDSMGSEGFPRRTENTASFSEDEVWETLDEKGNVIETKVLKSSTMPSTIYEVENNGNFSDYDQTIHDLQTIAGETSNANYQNMVETVSSPQNENWSASQACDNENVIRNEIATTVAPSLVHLSSPKRKLPESLMPYPSKHVNKSVYNSSYLPPEATRQDVDSDSEEEVWQTYEETVDTPAELLTYLQRQGKI